MKYALAIIFLLALAQNVAGEDLMESEHGIRLHIFGEKDFYVFETVNYTTISGSGFEGNVKVWIPGEATNMNMSIVDEVHFTPLDFELQGNIASFKLSIPESNFTVIYISYDMTVESQGLFEKQFTFETITQYPVERFSIVIISQPNYNVTASENLEILMPFRFSTQYSAYITGLVNSQALHGQQKIWIKFTQGQTQELLLYAGVAIVAVGAIGAAIVFFKNQKGKMESPDAEYEALVATLREVEEDHRAGKLSEGEYNKLKGEYEERKASVEKKLKKQ